MVLLSFTSSPLHADLSDGLFQSLRRAPKTSTFRGSGKDRLFKDDVQLTAVKACFQFQVRKSILFIRAGSIHAEELERHILQACY